MHLIIIEVNLTNISTNMASSTCKFSREHLKGTSCMREREREREGGRERERERDLTRSPRPTIALKTVKMNRVCSHGERKLRTPFYDGHLPVSQSLEASFPVEGGDIFFETNLRLAENIQNLLFPGPRSWRNSWPSPFPHLPHFTFNAFGLSLYLATESSCNVSVNAGHGV